ncbi:hypothetical protein GCM10023192_10050 [Amycolatopsis samaneae]
MGTPSRSARYSGSDRPAWRMNQTGVRAGRSPLAAASSGEDGSARRAAVAAGDGEAGEGDSEEDIVFIVPRPRMGPFFGAPAAASGRARLKVEA